MRRLLPALSFAFSLAAGVGATHADEAAPGATQADEAAPAETPAAEPQASAEEWEDEDDWLFADGPDPAERDAIEGSNRFCFGFNEAFYEYVADPIARGFAWLVPEPGRRALHRFFENLDSPALLINDMLQLAPLDASKTTARFAINSTVGLLGLFDPAGAIGIENHHTDFGETLAVWGTPGGSYVVIPLLGPSTARDTFGQMVDTALDPALWFASPVQQVVLRTSGGLSEYDVERVRLEALRATSVDFYAAIRGAYLMDRDAKVEERRAGRWWIDPPQPVVETAK
jgi:phospholipid-binding lipoprotein MlaA